jgi:hypothetical protein
MSSPMQRGLRWLPRILGVLFAAFLSLFALDVFGAGYGIWETIGALLIHLIPVWFLLVVLALAWRWPWVGSLAFLGFGVWYLSAAHGFHWSVYLVMAGAPIAIGVLFLASWWATPRHLTTT